ncbi:CvpA family protein [Candidatus Woesearchaeota archaeon]|jgi:membrane protein required for colicin V production|nr:CvpA family protein [Candidatus Woesearchaeota archaeon]
MSQLPWIDYCLLAIVAISAIAGLLRGLVREVLSLIAWAMAAWTGLHYAAPVSHLFTRVIEVPSLRVMAAFGVLFLTTLLVVSLAGWLISKLLESTGLSGMDQFAGLIFGGLRGILIASLLAFLGSMTPLVQDAWWKESRLLPTFQSLAVWLRGRLPTEYRDYFKSSVSPSPTHSP